MNSSAICPISTNKIDEHIARLNATFIVLLLAAFIFSNNLLIAIFLFIDFTLKIFHYLTYRYIYIYIFISLEKYEYSVLY